MSYITTFIFGMATTIFVGNIVAKIKAKKAAKKELEDDRNISTDI